MGEKLGYMPCTPGACDALHEAARRAGLHSLHLRLVRLRDPDFILSVDTLDPFPDPSHSWPIGSKACATLRDGDGGSFFAVFKEDAALSHRERMQLSNVRRGSVIQVQLAEVGNVPIWTKSGARWKREIVPACFIEEYSLLFP